MWMKFTNDLARKTSLLQMEDVKGKRFAILCDEAGVTVFFMNEKGEVDAIDPVAQAWIMNSKQDIQTHIDYIYRNLKE